MKINTADNKYLIIDLGQTNVKAFIGHFNGEKVWLEKVYRFYNKPVFKDGFLQWDILNLYNGIIESIKKSIYLGKNI